MLTGTDANTFSDFSDVHGNDAHAYLEENHMYQLQSKLEWYDFLETIDQKPIHNSEDHIIMDKSTLYPDEQAVHVAADMWQGALHGRSSTTSWVYARTYDTNSLLMDSLLNRPDVMSAIGKTNLDLNRVSDQMVALQNVDAKVGVLFSTSSRVYNRNYMNCLYKGYEALLYSGYRAAVLDEQAMAAGKWSGCDLIIIPDVTYVSSSMLTGLKSFVVSGGKILALGNNCLTYNDYKKANLTTDIQAVLGNATILATSYSSNQLTAPADTEILAQVRTLLPNQIQVVDSTTGEPLSKTEYRYTDYQGMKLINICRYVWENKNCDIYVDGKKVTQIYDVVKQKQLSSLNLTGYTPTMLYLDTSVVENPTNATASWENGQFKLSWTNPEGSSIDYMNIYMKDDTGTKLVDQVPASQTSYNFGGEVHGETTFVLKSVHLGFESSGISVALSNDLIVSIVNQNGQLCIQGYSKTGDSVAYTVVPNGQNPAAVFGLAAMGEIPLRENRSFSKTVNLNTKTDQFNDFTLYVGNGSEKKVLYFTYLKRTNTLENVFAVYQGTGYEIYWKSLDSSIQSLKISDGVTEKTIDANANNAYFTSENTKKTYTITTITNAGNAETFDLPTPIPLAFSCKVLDGNINLSGTAQPNETVQISVLDGETIVYMNQLRADAYGRFSGNFIIDNNKIPSSEEFTAQVITSGGNGKTHKMIYTGQFPIHIEALENQTINFTNYTSHAITNAKTMVAVYDQTKLIECYILDLSVGSGDSVEKVLTTTQNGYNTRIFVWDDISGMKPLSRSMSID